MYEISQKDAQPNKLTKRTNNKPQVFEIKLNSKNTLFQNNSVVFELKKRYALKLPSQILTVSNDIVKIGIVTSDPIFTIPKRSLLGSISLYQPSVNHIESISPLKPLPIEKLRLLIADHLNKCKFPVLVSSKKCSEEKSTRLIISLGSLHEKGWKPLLYIMKIKTSCMNNPHVLVDILISEKYITPEFITTEIDNQKIRFNYPNTQIISLYCLHLEVPSEIDPLDISSHSGQMNYYDLEIALENYHALSNPPHL
ncbi:hypothetical protein A3Q56_02847 [Intoshia linei]|uniref:Uncharacterized protein n=1 Tax=Intoshia linei TaxID=1819745 RepID=A0A177B562_9BILA|nr:hypothetical protein A3Q56_02847 [Intoshia linei]